MSYIVITGCSPFKCSMQTTLNWKKKTFMLPVSVLSNKLDHSPFRWWPVARKWTLMLFCPKQWMRTLSIHILLYDSYSVCFDGNAKCFHIKNVYGNHFINCQCSFLSLLFVSLGCPVILYSTDPIYIYNLSFSCSCLWKGSSWKSFPYFFFQTTHQYAT